MGIIKSATFGERVLGFLTKDVVSLTVSGGQEFHLLHFSRFSITFFFLFYLKRSIFLSLFSLRMSESPNRKGPGYATASISAISYDLNA